MWVSFLAAAKSRSEPSAVPGLAAGADHRWSHGFPAEIFRSAAAGYYFLRFLVRGKSRGAPAWGLDAVAPSGSSGGAQRVGGVNDEQVDEPRHMDIKNMPSNPVGSTLHVS